MRSKGSHEQTFELMGMRKTSVCDAFSTEPEDHVSMCSLAKETCNRQELILCLHEERESFSLCPHCSVLIFSVQHFCVGVASSPHLQFFRAAEFETKAKYTGPFIKPFHGVEREEEKR